VASLLRDKLFESGRDSRVGFRTAQPFAEVRAIKRGTIYEQSDGGDKDADAKLAKLRAAT